MKCRLCHRETKLLKKSHIIPKYLFKQVFKLEKVVLAHTGLPGKVKRVHTGLYEPDILCKDCDNKKLGGLEDYSRRILYGANPNDRKHRTSKRQSRSEDGLLTVDIGNLNYHKLKLFFWSMVWRAHWSTQSMYDGVSLGEHENTIRNMILSGNAGGEDEYPVALAYLHLDQKYSKVISPILKVKTTEWDGYIMNAGGMCYLYNVLPANSLSIFDKGKIQESGKLEVGVLEGDLAKSMLEYFISF